MQIGQVGDLLDELDRPDEEVGLVGERDTHVDVEDVGAAGDLRGDVLLDDRQVALAQRLLEDGTARGVDPLPDDAERLVGRDDDLLGRRPQHGAAQGGAHADTIDRRASRRALARLTVAEASEA